MSGARPPTASRTIEALRERLVDEIAREIGRRGQTREVLGATIRCTPVEISGLRSRQADSFSVQRLIKVGERLGLSVTCTVERRAA